ncbi:MAG TPA: amidohydrolase family protein, partial [Burkholderiaceae bacterium]|nr:amidohydrolase family protein [Burkholderiaceae bacterium]
MSVSTTTSRLAGARLPRWCLPSNWPVLRGQPALADIAIAQGRIAAIVPHDASAPIDPASRHLRGAPVLPGLVEAHTHIDKAFTRGRLGAVAPGLLAAIEAMKADRADWTADDVRERAGRALQWAGAAGVTHVRTHCDWWEPDAAPIAWQVLRELGDAWSERLQVERVSLIPLHLFPSRDAAHALARTVAASGPGARLGGFVHTTNWDPAALRHLFEAAEAFGLDVDLHVDEELNPQARGLATTAALVREMGFGGRVVCGHACALAAQDETLALATLDALARAPITLVSLPTTNLLLQDARTGRTPRQRGLTLVKEARERGIPVLISTDNVQDAFCAFGTFDPVEALAVGALTAQLDDVFDTWTEAICRRDWLSRTPRASGALAVGDRADFVIFEQADAMTWPARAHRRTVIRAGLPIASTQ